ncbi:MAG: acyl-CoA dehydrogenase [Alphaproteobacteria bacterium]|nr:MAG: acyl-CoA dehydrogenase [Alphaproteobacteria bacterium]
MLQGAHDDHDETTGQLVDTIRRFVWERLIPAEEEVAERDELPDAIKQEMKELGLFGLTIPEAYGGLGLGMREEVLIAFELGQCSPAFRSYMGPNNGIGSLGLVYFGTEEQKRKYLPKLASGEILGSFALTEPGAGSDAASLTTRAERDGDHYVLNGTKRFITNAPEAGLITVMARTGSQEEGAQGISAFLVEAGTPGLSIGPHDRKMGLRGSHTSDVILEDCRVHKDQLLGGREGIGFTSAMKTLDRGRLQIAGIAVGASERLIHEALSYALERKQFGRPIAEFQLVQAMLADSKAETYAARSMVLDAAVRGDAGEPITLLASCCKLFASETCGRVADRAVQIHGGSGFIRDFAVERFYRDVRLFRLYEGTSEIQKLIIAREMIGAAS